MQLTIENIGLIRQAKIQINGLTVIAGANDSGKSTVGKVIFSLVKAIQRYQDDLEQGKTHQLENQAIQQALKNVLYSEFMGDFRRQDMGVEESSKLELKEGENDLFQATLTATDLKTQLFDQLIYQDATFIETPYVLNLPAVIRAARARFDDTTVHRTFTRSPNIALHIQDLNDKLREGGLLMDEIDFDDEPRPVVR